MRYSRYMRICYKSKSNSLRNRQVTIVTIHNYANIYEVRKVMYLYNTWEETGDESVECRALRKFLRQIELHKTGASCMFLVCYMYGL